MPVAHSVPLQLGWSVVVEYVPGLQSKQPPSLYLPLTHVDEHVCGWLAALLRYSPVGQVLSVHGELSVCTEYLPDPHGAHDESANVVPATRPIPLAHVVDVVCDRHSSPPTLLEYLPAEQGKQLASSATAEPCLRPMPEPHDVMDLGVHAELSLALE